MRCGVPKKRVPSVAVINVESADKALMPSSVAERLGTWSRTANRTRIRLEVMLSLGRIHRVKQQPILLRGTGSTP